MASLYYNKIWAVQGGIFLNYLGWGAVLPFEVIYLHDGRGFGLGLAGLVVGVVTGLAVVAAPAAGPLIDRAGPRATAAGAAVLLAAGYGGLAAATVPWQAFAAAALAGAGNGGLQPAQSALLTAMVPAALRHRTTAVSRVASNLGIGLGGAIGGLVASGGLRGFVVLFLANALSYLVHAAILVAVVPAGTRPAPVAGGYRVLLRDRPFVKLAVTNVAVIGVGWGAFTWVVPPYARAELGLRPTLIGSLLTANALTVIVAQLPVARLAEGRGRAATMAAAALTFASAFLVVAGAAAVAPRLAYPALLAAACAVGLGECLHTTVLIPLAADLAPPALRGRYLAAVSLSWWLGLALAPTIGTQLLERSPPLALLAAAAVALGAAGSARSLERDLPAATRITPRPADT